MPLSEVIAYWSITVSYFDRHIKTRYHSMLFVFLLLSGPPFIDVFRETTLVRARILSEAVFWWDLLDIIASSPLHYSTH